MSEEKLAEVTQEGSSKVNTAKAATKAKSTRAKKKDITVQESELSSNMESVSKEDTPNVKRSVKKSASKKRRIPSKEGEAQTPAENEAKVDADAGKVQEEKGERPKKKPFKKNRRKKGKHDKELSEEQIQENMENKLRTMNPVTHDANDSARRRKKRSRVSKLSNKLAKRKKRDGNDYSSAFNPESPVEIVEGVLQLDKRGGYLRQQEFSFSAKSSDVFVPREFIDKMGLRTGLRLEIEARTKKKSTQKVVGQILKIQGDDPISWKSMPHFQDLTSVNPFEQYKLSSKEDFDQSMNLMELLTPVGKGQRALIVAPPRSGKTVLMEKIVNGITDNHPEAEVMMLLIDERPEEVTHLSRKVKGTVLASCLDKPIEEHLSLSRMVIEMAMRRVEEGKDVVILLDSITRMARAFNNQLKSSGRTLTGGVDAQALHEPKKFFGAARKVEEGGSLTIIATALVQTGSQMDEVIFQEFKGTGNMELVLNRKIAEKRIWPAIDVNMSGTRREELIMPSHYYKASLKFRRYLSSMSGGDQIQAAIQAMEKCETVEDFVKGFS